MDADFFNMGGYAFYVWVSYGLSAVVLVANAVLPTKREKFLLEEIAKRAQES
jgi:heme exporter protein D